MIILISPSKSIDMCSTPFPKEVSQPSFLKESKTLIKILSSMSEKEVGNFLKVSDKLSKLNYDRFKNWSTPFNSNNSKPAILSFTGDVYDSLSVKDFTHNDYKYAQNKLLILSGLYGILKPLDLIQPYRLEMGRNLKTNNAKNLYQFWSNKISNYIQNINDDTIINLASNEYYKVINPKLIKKNVITPIFKDKKNGEYKMISFYAKKARGMMSRYIIKNQINNSDDLNDFNVSGYSFSKKLSLTNQPVFVR